MPEDDAIWSAMADSPIALDAALQRIFEWDCEDTEATSGYWCAVARLLRAAPHMQARILELESALARQDKAAAQEPVVDVAAAREAEHIDSRSPTRIGRIRWMHRSRNT